MKSMHSKHKTESLDSASKCLTSPERKLREEALANLSAQEFFAEGRITINKRTCRGVECRLCINACPTSALFWKTGEVGISKELCVYCGACVLSCIVDNCIEITRKRPTGRIESFNNHRDFAALQRSISDGKRLDRIGEALSELAKPQRMNHFTRQKR